MMIGKIARYCLEIIPSINKKMMGKGCLNIRPGDLGRLPDDYFSQDTLVFFDGFRKVYKFKFIIDINNFRIVNMHPGNLAVAGCFYFSEGGIF